ncbi:MAG: hypothetical protein R2942_19995 [Ignavibacteria bacterium]
MKKFIPGSDYSDDKIYLIQLLLIEKDNGGAGEFLTEFYEATKEYIDAFILTTELHILCSSFAAAVPTMGASLVLLIASVAATLTTLVIGKLIELIGEALKDDVLKQQEIIFQL